MKIVPDISNYAYDNYIKPSKERRKKIKSQSIKNWLSQNWINLATLIFTVLTLLATVLFGLLQLLH